MNESWLGTEYESLDNLISRLGAVNATPAVATVVGADSRRRSVWINSQTTATAGQTDDYIAIFVANSGGRCNLAWLTCWNPSVCLDIAHIGNIITQEIFCVAAVGTRLDTCEIIWRPEGY